MRIHVASVHEESLFIWLCISWAIIQFLQSMRNIYIYIYIYIYDNALFILLFSIWACVWTCQVALLSLRVRESSHESLFLRFILMYILGESMSHPFDFCERGERPFFSISGSLFYPSFHLFQM